MSNRLGTRVPDRLVLSDTLNRLAPLPTLAGCLAAALAREIALNCMTYGLAQPAECSEATPPKSAYLNRFPASLISPADGPRASAHHHGEEIWRGSSHSG